MKIPKKIKIGGHVYTVEFPHKFKDLDDRFAQHSYNHLSILITDTAYDGDKRDDQWIVTSLLHEVIHAIDSIYIHKVLTEEYVEAMSFGLLQVFRDNKSTFDILSNTKWIPKKLNILGYIYKIKYPYVFSEDESVFFVLKNSSCEVLIDDGQGKIHKSVLKCAMLDCIITAIEYINKFNLDNIVETSLAQGLYQVLVDNRDFAKCLRM